MILNINVHPRKKFTVTENGIAIGPRGYTPEIGENGNWWINGVDTGVRATGFKWEDLTELQKDELRLKFDDLTEAQKLEIKGDKGDKGDAFQYSDFTPEQIEDLKQPAVEAAEYANEIANHPTYIGSDHYVYEWDHATQSYNKTGTYCKGDAFNVKKTYASVAAMEADFEGTDTKQGDFVLIVTGNVEDADNAKLYVKEATQWTFLVDMSGAIGFTGKTPQLSIGTVTTGEPGSDVAVTISEDGVDEGGNPRFKLNFAIPQGAKGDKGDPFTYEDFTPEQIATLQQPATAAAQLLEEEVSNVSTIVEMKIIDENTVLATGDGQGSFVVPEELNGCEILKVHAAVSTPSSSGLPTFQLRTLAGNDVLSTKVSIDATENTSYTATTPHVVNPTYKTVATGDILFPDVDIAGTGTKGARLIITFKHPTV